MCISGGQTRGSSHCCPVRRFVAGMPPAPVSRYCATRAYALPTSSGSSLTSSAAAPVQKGKNWATEKATCMPSGAGSVSKAVAFPSAGKKTFCEDEVRL